MTRPPAAAAAQCTHSVCPASVTPAENPAPGSRCARRRSPPARRRRPRDVERERDARHDVPHHVRRQVDKQFFRHRAPCARGAESRAVISTGARSSTNSLASQATHALANIRPRRRSGLPRRARPRREAVEHKSSGDASSISCQARPRHAGGYLKEGVEKVKASAATPAELADLVLLVADARDTQSRQGRARFLPDGRAPARRGGARHRTSCRTMGAGRICSSSSLGRSTGRSRRRSSSSSRISSSPTRPPTPRRRASRRRSSLLGKRAPREGGAHERKAKLASLIATAMFGANKPAAQRKYRKLVAKLNAALGTSRC